jgi:hypothetical protein
MKNLPKYFVIKQNITNPLWNEYISWLNNTYDQNWSGDSKGAYYGYDGGMTHNGTVFSQHHFFNTPTIITLEEWHEVINNNKNVQTITREQLKQIKNIVCSTWKDKIDDIARNNLYSDNIELTNEMVNNIFNASSFEQLKVLDSIGLTVKPCKSNIELAIDKTGDPEYTYCKVVIKDDNIIAVSLPASNKEWTFAAFKWVMKFCELNPDSYPIWLSYDNANYLYIQYNSY